MNQEANCLDAFTEIEIIHIIGYYIIQQKVFLLSKFRKNIERKHTTILVCN